VASLVASPAVTSLHPTTLAFEDWNLRKTRHENRVAPFVEAHLARSSAGERHPIYDFLFEYYSLRPSLLLRWHPGVGIVLTGPEALACLAFPHYRERENPAGVSVCPQTFKIERLPFLRWLRQFLRNVQARPPFFGCSGLHEWAMVYQTRNVRHPAWPLRFCADTIARIVESLPICCSHYDAFRFFTPAAEPLNRLRPTRQLADQFDQPGCLHANMDLYKWSYKLAPFTSSELVADAFLLARDIREIDMRASPYDFSNLGFAPIPIETTPGRTEYEGFQRSFHQRAIPIRERLLDVCETLLEQLESTTPE